MDVDTTWLPYLHIGPDFSKPDQKVGPYMGVPIESTAISKWLYWV